MKLFLSLLLLLSACACGDGVTPPPEPASLPPHPRLVLTAPRVAALRAARAANATDAALFFAQLEAHAVCVLAQPPVPHGVPGPSGILMAVRASMDILLTAAAAHALRDNASDGRFLARAVVEALNLCVTWPDWNTAQHALDTGEALLATALAYDWLHADLDAATRAAIAGGVVSRGLAPYRASMNNRSAFWWRNNSINWNCVCSAGGAVAVLALFGDAGAPAWAWTDVLQPLVSATGVAPCVAAYNVDSSWEEGPGYWAYASKFNAWLFASLQTALGDAGAAGLLALPGVAGAARFPLWSTGANALPLGAAPPSSKIFNWADSEALGEGWTPFSQWWGSAAGFGDAVAAFWSRLGSRMLGPGNLNSPAWAGFVEALAFYEPRGSAADVVALPTNKLFAYINVGIFRSAWDAAQQNYISFKGGNSGWNHGHLDLGSFVQDFDGRRIVEDLGADSYNLPGYFGPQRFTYYRLNSLGHNVPIFANASQAHPAAAPITAFNATGRVAGNISVDGFAVVDLTAAYAASAGAVSARRGFVSLAGAAALIIVDAFAFGNATRPANVSWRVHTRAAAVPVGTLQIGLDFPRAQLAVLQGATACMGSFAGWAITNATTLLPDPPFNSAVGLSRVEALFNNPAPSCSALAFAVGESAIVSQLFAGYPAVRPIDEWALLGPLEA